MAMAGPVCVAKKIGAYIESDIVDGKELLLCLVLIICAMYVGSEELKIHLFKL